MSQDRVLPLEGVHNFRDYGGYPVAGGGRIRRGVLWRSGQHFGATDADLARIDALGLGSVFDLRSDAERALHPCRRPEGFAAKVFHAASPAARKSPQAAAPHAVREPSAQRTREGLTRNYEKIMLRPELQAAMSAMFVELLDGDGPSLVNCMAGKDRTGIAVAMVHSALGVHRDDIVADYLLTNTAGDSEARIAAGKQVVYALSGPLDDDVVRVLMGVEPEYIETALTRIDEEFGSIEGYLDKALGIDTRAADRLRERFVEDDS